MINLHRFGAVCTLALIAATWAAPVPAFAATMGTSQGQDLDALLAQAERQIGLAGRDAVVLVESQRVAISANGDKTTRIHRVVWIGAAVGIRDHADLRIPYHSDTSTMTVAVLRTWRDERWWPDATHVSGTAVVETLPFDLAQADDYTGMRETMLLHDGVEIPCIMETAWEIEERGTAAGGTDGLWVFPQRDPAVRVEFVLTAPAGGTLRFHCGNGAPDPVVTRETDGSTTHAWTMEDVERLGSPLISDPASYAPYVAYSTWENWEALGERTLSSFDEAAVLSDELADTISGRLEGARSASESGRRVTAFVEESTRSIHYDSRFWGFDARPAPRTWETAYGHALDRAVLAAALFREAGLEARPVFRSVGAAGIDIDAPSLSRFTPIGLVVTGDGLGAFYDPYDGKLVDGVTPFFGRFVWIPGDEGRPSPGPGLGDAEATSDFSLVITLEPAEDGSWAGTGYLSANGCFSPHAEMVGLVGEALALLKRVAGSVLPGSTVEAFNPEVFTREEVRVGFSIKTKAIEKDDQGRTSITLGEPAGGVVSKLPADVHLYHEKRSSPVTIAGSMTQRTTLRLKTGQREIVYMPEPREIENEAGRYVLTASHADGWVSVEREITLRAAAIQPEEWPLLRALLLEEADPAGSTIIPR
jgi:hypothetical protein